MAYDTNENGQIVVKLILDGMPCRFSNLSDDPQFKRLHVYQKFIPPFGLLKKEVIEEKLSAEHLIILRHHAKAFACLSGNAFGPQTEYQYVGIAYANLWSNGALGDIPNLYPATCDETCVAISGPDSANYDWYHMTEAWANEIKSHFVQ